MTLTLSVNPMSGKVVAEAKVQNRVSGHEKNIEKGERVVQNENGACTKKEDEAANLLPGVEERLGNFVLSTSTTTQMGTDMRRTSEHVHGMSFSPSRHCVW